MLDRIGIIGAGAWGTALANAAARAGRDVALWTRDCAHAQAMRTERRNERRLPGIALVERVTPTADLAVAAAARAVLVVTPAQTLAGLLPALALVLRQGVPVILCAKGIDRQSGFFLSDLAIDALPGCPVAVLSGPSFAHDVARGLPTAVSLACGDAIVAQALAEALSGATLRVYHGTDMRGVEIGGAAKNVLGIAAGTVVGAGLGESARAALVARGFAELMRFAKAWGAQPETLMGLSGLGDVVLTCGSARSRNFAFGEAMGRASTGGDPAHKDALVEGASTAQILLDLARARGVDMPIVEGVANLVAGRAGVRQTIDALMARPLRAE